MKKKKKKEDPASNLSKNFGASSFPLTSAISTSTSLHLSALPWLDSQSTDSCISLGKEDEEEEEELYSHLKSPSLHCGVTKA